MPRWPERVLAIGGFFLWAALLPTVHGGPYPASGTAALTAAVLGAFSVAQARLKLRMAAAVTFLSAFTWFIIFAEAISG